MTIDWSKWGAPAVIFAILAFVATWIRPAMAALIHNLWRSDPSRAVETAMIVWKTEAGRLQMKSYLRDVLKEELALSKEALDVAHANADSLRQVTFTQEAQGISLKQIEDSIKEVPRLTDALDRISESMKTYADHMQEVSDFMSRADERERLRERYERGALPDRRHRQTPEPHPHKRDGE